MKTGIIDVDSQHMELVNLINGLTLLGGKAASKEETEKAIDFLGDYVVKHFKDEEELQKSSGYPNYNNHAAIHNLFIMEFQKLRNRFFENGPSPLFTLTLNNTVIAWVITHIKGADKEFGDYYVEYMAKKS